MVRSLVLAFCALLCLFVLSARSSEVNVPWPPSSLPDCDSPWDRYGDAYNFCHATFDGTNNDPLWDSFGVSNVEIEPCNWDYFLLDAASYGDLQVGDWLQISLDYGVDSPTPASSSLSLVLSFTGVPPTSITNDVEDSANTTYTLSPWTLSMYPEIWVGVGHYRRNADTAPGHYNLFIQRYRTYQECEECICDPAWGYEEIDLTSTNDNQIVLSGSVSYSNDTRPDFDADADATYSLLRNFYFNVPSSVYRPGAYLDINVTILDDSTGAVNAYLSEGPYAVDPKSSDPHYSQVISLGSCGICPNDISVSGSNCHLFLTPCDFYYGDYYLSLEFENFCPTGASYEIIVNVVAPIVQPLTLAGSPQAVSFSNDLQTNIFLGAQADYSQYDHYVLTVSGITDRTHAFARLTSVYGYNMGLYWRASSQTDNAIAFEDRDRVLVPRTFNGNSTCDDSCYDVDNYCTTLESSPSGSACGCSFYVRSCDLEETNYYLSVVPLQNSGAYVDVQSYHIEVSTHEDTLQIALVPGEPISTTLSVYSPFQVYVFATPNAVDTWAVFELFVRSVSSSNNQLAQPALKLDLQQSIAFFDDSFICSDSQKDALQTCTTSSEFYRDGYSAELPGVSYPTACHLFVDSCKLKYGAVYLSVSALSDDISSFGITEGHWDYVLWGDLETPWALESDVTYTDRVRVDQYNHYYIDVDDSIEAGAWLSVDFEQINAIGSANFISYLNYESLAGDCPCYKNVDICQLSSGTITPDSCESDEHCDYNPNGWSSSYGFDLEDNAYPVQTENDAGACRVQATACSFRPGRWYISASAYSGSSGSGSISIGRDAIPVALPTLPVDTGDSVEFVGYTITARIHAAPVVSELEFNSLVTEQLAPSEVLHFQLTDIDADGDDLVISVHWYSEVLSRFYEASGCLASSTSPKSFADDWGVELRLNFGDLAFDECYEHPWSCKADVNHGASCEIIVPACKWAVVDPEQIFVSARYNRGLFTADYYETLLNGCSLDKRVDPLDVLAPEFWVGNAQINLQVTSERAEVTALAVGTPIYGSVLKDRYAHYTFQLLSTQSLRTDIDVYFHVQSTIDYSESAPIVALNSGALAGNGRGCRDCFSALRSCQDIANCHWTFDSCNGLSTDTDYYLSVYKPANAFYNQALEFSIAVSQQDLVIPVSLGSANRLTTSIALQNGDSTRAFFAIDGSSLPERVTPLDYLSIRLWNNGIATSGFTYYLNHGGLAGACDCFTARCQNTVSLAEECPINSDSENFVQIYEKDLSAGTYFLTLEFPGASASNGVVFTIEVELVTYEVVARTPTNLRGSSNTQFFLGDANLRYGEDITLDYNEGYNMDNWLTTTGGLIDWDETNNVIRDEKIYGWRNIPQYFGLQAPERFSDASQLFKFYAITITNPADEPGHVMPDRVFLGIDNIRSDIDNCYTFDAENLVVFWHGTEDQALAPINAEVNQAERACTSYPANYGLSIGSPSGSPVSPVLFTELPVCLFTHAGAATHYFSVALTGDYSAWELDLADIESVETVFPAVVYDIRFFLQKPIVMQDLEAFYTATSNYLTETVGFPFTTNWQPLLSQNGAGSPTLFKQRFVLDLTGSGDLSDSLVQVVIETDNQLFVTVNGDYAPNQPITTGGATCWFNECSSRSLLEFRQSTLSYLQLNPAAIGDDYVSAAANNTMNFVDPSSDFVYTCETDSCVFTLDPCALSQTSLWYFDITSSGNNASFAIYYTEPEDLITGNVYEIAAIDIEDRNWVPTGTTTFGGVDGVDDYEFYHISSSVLSEVLSGEGRARLEIQVDWEEKFTTQEFANDQWASVVISAEKPLYVRGQQSQFPFSNPAYNDAFTADTLPTNFIWTDSSDIPYCFEPFYISVSGGAYNTTNSAASGAERFFLDGCDLQGISELWLTARMLTPGYFDFQFLVRVVRDKEIDATDQTIGTGYASAASITVESDTTSAIEPNSFNHHKFVLPSTLQSESAAATTVNVELFFPDDQIYRNNGTYWLLFSTDAPAGWTGTATPDNYVSSTDSRYPLYNGLRTFGSMASEGSIPLGSRVKYDCYSNLIQYTADPITFDPLDTGFVPVGDFDAEYRSRRTIDLFNFRYATYLYVSVYYETDWEQFFPDEQDETDLWQGYIVNVWLQPQPSEESPFPIHQNGSALDLCYDGLDGVTTDTGIYPNVAGFDYNISWAGGKSLLVTWFSFELTEDLISLDCSLSSTDSECYFTQYLEFQIFNDDFLQDSTTGTPELYFDGDFGVYGPGSISLGGELNDFDTTASDFDMFGGSWVLHDSRVDGDDRRSNLQSLDLNTSSPVWQFGPCSAQSSGYSYLPDRDWEFDESFSSPVGRYTLRAGLYYIPIWSFDSLDLTICASLNSIGYDYTWINPATPYEPNVLTDYDTGAADSSVDTLAQVVVDWNDLGGDRYDYYWFQLSEAEITSSQQYLQIWLDRVLECTDGTPVVCGSLPADDRLILQMFRSDCQLWSCDASGNGAGCEGRWQTGTDNEDGNFGDVSRFILGGAGLSSCSLTAGDFFIKVYLPQSATYTLSVYLRTPPTLTLTEAVAVRSTIYSATFQHYQFTASDTSSSLLTSLTAELTEVLCGSLELFAKHGTPAGPFYPTNLDRTTFIGSQMYSPNTFLPDDDDFDTYVSGSSFEKCASAYCIAADGDRDCSIHIGTTELSKDLDSTGLIGSTTWFFAVRSISAKYYTDNDASIDSFMDPFVTSDSASGNGFTEPSTYFITVTTTYADLSAGSIGCAVVSAEVEPACPPVEPSESNPSVVHFGFETVTLFTDAVVYASSYSLNATVVSFAKPDGVNQFLEPIDVEAGDWTHLLSSSSPLSVVGPQNVFTSEATYADFYHYPVTLLSPGIIYSSTGHGYSVSSYNTFLSSKRIFYEFSPALTSTVSFSLTLVDGSGSAPSCVRPKFWIEEDCGVFASASPSDSLFLTSCPDALPRFFSFCLGSCSGTCAQGECYIPVQWEFGYSPVPITDLELGVQSCGDSWEVTPVTAELSSGSCEKEWVFFSLPETPEFTGETANWLSLDFYTELEYPLYDSNIYFYDSDSYLCPTTSNSGRDDSYEHGGFVCPGSRNMAVRSDSFVNDISTAAITPSLFSIPVIDSAATLSTSTFTSTVEIEVKSTDAVWFDLLSGYAIYKVTVPDIDSSVSSLSFAFDSSYGCSNFDWWINFGAPLPEGCADVSTDLLPCEFQSGDYFVTLRFYPINPYYYSDWSAILQVSLTTAPVLAVPEDGTFSASYTLPVGESVLLQTSLSSGWLKSHPALQSAFFYRVISPLGIYTLSPEFDYTSSACFDCLVPLLSTTMSNPYDAPLTFTVQFELISDLFLLIDPNTLLDTPSQPASALIASYDQLLWIEGTATPLLTPYFDQRSATVNAITLGTTISSQLYNAFTSRQIQAYVVDTVTANSLAQLRLANVVGGLVSMQVFPASLVSGYCGDFKECHSAPLQWSDNHQLLQASPLNNIAGSCSLVYSPCEWAASPSWFVVLHDHVLNEPTAYADIYDNVTSPIGSNTHFDFGVNPENSTSPLPIDPDFFFRGDYTPTQNNPLVAVTFDLIVTEESWTALSSTPSAAVSFSEQASTPRSEDNPAGNWQHFFYSYEASGVTSVRIIVDVSAASAQATSGVWVTVTDSDCGCGHLFRNVWCSAEYPSWLCEIEVALHAEHPLESSTFFVDVYGLKGTFSVSATEGLEGNCVFSDGESFCPTRILNYPFWPSLDSSDLDDKASCLYDELLSFFETPCDSCYDVIDDECQLALMEYACAATFQPCDVDGFIDASICVDKCTAVESACPYSFVQAGLPNLDCGHARYSSSNCF